jgi:hypothetical protein
MPFRITRSADMDPAEIRQPVPFGYFASESMGNVSEAVIG